VRGTERGSRFPRRSGLPDWSQTGIRCDEASLPSEIPPSVNSLKGSSSVLLVLAKTSLSQSKEIAGLLAESLSLKKFRILSEDGLKERDLEGNDILLVGLTERRSFFFKMPEGLVLQKQRFKVNGKDYERPSDSFFGVFRTSAYEERLWPFFSRYPKSMR